MSWKIPMSLQRCAAQGVCRPIVRATEDRVRRAISLVPAELLIARATADLLVRDEDEESDPDDDDDDDNKWDTTPEELRLLDRDGVDLPGDMDVLEFALLHVKVTVGQVRQWMACVPSVRTGPLGWMEAALTAETEIHPRHHQDFARQVSALALQLALLPDVFLDPDYSDQDRRCLVPFAWERWVARLVARLAPFPQLQRLRVYGGLYPSILAAVLRGASHLTALHISHINITDNILLTAARCCPHLTSLLLLHNFPWQVISTHAFYAAFFNEASRRTVTRSKRNGCNSELQLSFPALREVEVAYGNHEVAREFHQVLVALYPGLTALTCPWKNNIFEDGYGSHGGLVLLPLLPRPGLSLTTVFFDVPTLAGITPLKMRHLVAACPQTTCFTLDCGLSVSTSLCEIAGSRLAQLVAAWPQLEKLHINVSDKDHLTHRVVMPALTICGNTLTVLTLEAAAPGQQLYLTTVTHLLQMCPLLYSLTLRVWSRNQVALQQDSKDSQFMPPCSALRYFSLHEDGPGDSDDGSAESRNVESWTTLLSGIVTAAPDLTTLSTSVCRGLTSLLDKLTCHVTTLHLHVCDPQDWQPSADQLVALVTRVPSLQQLYLEEVSGKIFWRVRRRFLHTDLHLYWGNLHGWPRT
ncbi:hypothetical protein Pmani_017443 [Petrolisthes manimaculis]|uniref:Uncharacterized protein n=1 Tax=Petrolisthes manimaculis TaxID=1843537 RepID=A0AAE1U5G2_9EUCA|nr:hypothetical protein Pmani_017443 [Petrolisthes manimaculis]